MAILDSLPVEYSLPSRTDGNTLVHTPIMEGMSRLRPLRNDPEVRQLAQPQFRTCR